MAEAPQDAPQRIPRGCRGAILNYFEGTGADPDQIFEQLQLRAGFGDYHDLIQHVSDVYGAAVAEAMKELAWEEMQRAVADALGVAGQVLSPSTTALKQDHARRTAEPRAYLLHVPDALFATAIEGAFAAQIAGYLEYGNPPPTVETERFVNEHLEKTGAPYRLNDETVTWVGDKVLDEMAIKPGLQVLADARLETARGDFEHALNDLRAGTKRSLKDAVGYGTKALEGAMVAVLEAHGRDLPDKTQVAKLWSALHTEPELAPDMSTMSELVMSAVRVRNEKGQHSDPREVTLIEAEVSITAAANAIHYLANLLPPAE